MKKILIPIVIATALLALSGCNKENTSIPVPDNDFDGLLNEIDPDPNNNKYYFHLEDGNKNPYSVQDNFVMDYREFFRSDLTTTYNSKLAKLATLMLNETYWVNFVFENNVYTSPSTNISKLLTQIGCTDLVFKDFSRDTFIHDKNDIVNLKLGHHVVDDGTKKLNVTIVEVFGYPSDAQWESNFHIGADTQAYIDTTGEHEDWLEKNNHKGFDVTAKRAFDYLTTYLNDHKVSGVNDFVFIAGHSRSAATASLIGKKLKDNNFNSLVYAFNTPLHIADTSKEVCESYSNIWQILNDEDFVSKVPLSSWNNFTHLGHILTYKMSEHASKYNSYYLNRSYPTVDDQLLTKLTGALEKIITSRENIYLFREADPNFKEVILKSKIQPFDTEEEANAEIESYYNDFNDSEAAKKIIEMTVAPYSLNPNKFQINYRTKPQIIVSIANDIFANGTPDILDIINVLQAYLPFMHRYLNDISEEMKYLLDNLSNNINQIAKAHEEYVTFIACTLF